MDFIDYYKILGVEKNASADDIKKAYRKLARKLHPDLNPNDKNAHQQFQKINEANEVLSDPEKRKKYDQYGENWKHADQFEQQRQSGRRQQYAGEQQFSYDTGNDFSDFFESLFGHRERASQAKFKGQDFQAELNLNLSDIMQANQQTFTINGKNIRISIPAGVENGQVIKLKGYGSPGVNGGPDGDLYITFTIANDPHFKRLGNDLYTTATIDLYTALLGGETTIDTLTGKVKLTIKPETQNGTKVRLKGKGVPVYKKEGAAGDLYVTYEIKLPTNLTQEQKELIKKLSQLK